MQKVSLDAGFTCPNVDGTVATGGCVFCDNRSFSPSRRVPRQADRRPARRGHPPAETALSRRRAVLAYFQPATNTYAPVDRLRQPSTKRRWPIRRVVGLAIGTRPDCVPDEVLDLLAEIAGRT